MPRASGASSRKILKKAALKAGSEAGKDIDVLEQKV